MIPLVTGIAGFALALNGWLYQPKKEADGPSRWSNYTVWGRILLLLIIFTNVTAIVTGWVESRNKEEAAVRAEDRLKKQEAVMDDLRLNTSAISASAEASRQQVASLEEQLTGYQVQLGNAVSKISELNAINAKLQGKLESYQAFIERIEAQSERQPQIVMTQFVRLEPGRMWRAPNRLYSESYVEFYGWQQAIELSYGDKRERIRPIGWASPSKIAVVGKNGETFDWGLRNLGVFRAEGKIIVFSTPRSRSVEWSWIEEQIEALPTSDQ